MNNPPYWPNPNDPNDPHSQDTVAGQYPTFPQPNQPSQYPQFGQQAPPPPQFPSGPGQYSQSEPNFPPYPQLGQFGPPPVQQQKLSLWRRFRSRRKRFQFGVGCATLFVVFFLCTGTLAAIGSTMPNPPAAVQPSPAPTHRVMSVKKQVSTAKPIQKPTPAPVPKTTAALSPLTPTNGPLQIGQPVSNFIGAYGQPSNADLQKSGEYLYLGGAITVFAYPQDNNLVGAVLYDNTDGNGWGSLEEATTACRVYIPGDSIYKRTIDIGSPNPATERVYISASLAPLFKPDKFYDENQNTTTAGTFGIVYTYDTGANSNRVLNCSVQIGLQGN